MSKCSEQVNVGYIKSIRARLGTDCLFYITRSGTTSAFTYHSDLRNQTPIVGISSINLKDPGLKYTPVSDYIGSFLQATISCNPNHRQPGQKS
jgi:hypothetical protein